MKWWQFTKERFDPFSHTIMIFLFVILHVLFVKNINHEVINLTASFVLFLIVFIFYFKLRLYDEIKDYELDCKINPTRPLPRGLLSLSEVKKAIAICIVLQIGLYLAFRPAFIWSHLFAIAYSLLMYKEFFISKTIRKHLTTYAVTHTVVTVFLTLSMFSFLREKSFLELLIDKNSLYLALSNWMLFNIFEFGRKSYQLEEERDHVETYTSLFKKEGASLLVLSQSILSLFLITRIDFFNSLIYSTFFIIILSLLILFSLFFVFSKKILASKIYRIFSSLYIVLFFVFLIIGFFV